MIRKAIQFLLCVLSVSVFGSTLAQPATRPAPPFMIGVWYQPASSLPRWKGMGINTAVGVLIEPNVTAADYVNWAHVNGLYVVGKPAEADAHEHVDEPDGAGGVAANDIVTQFKAWKGEPGGASKPVLLTLDGWRTQYGQPDDYAHYCQGADWIAFDYYVINRGEGPDAIKKLGERIDQLKAWAPGKRILAFIEVSDQDLRISDLGTSTLWGPALAPKMRGPTPDEVGAEVQVCVAHGASGVIYFPQKIGKQWEAHDVMPAEVGTRIALINAKLAPAAATLPTAPPATLPTPVTVPTGPPVVVVAATQISVPAPTFPDVHVRVMTDENLTPVGGQFPAFALCDSLGMEHCTFAYRGTFNRSPWWATRANLDEFNRLGFGGTEGALLFDPPDEAACRAIGALAANPGRFGGKAQRHTPMFIDIEGGSYSFLTSDTPAQRIAKVKVWRDAVGWLRAGANADASAQEVYFYGQYPFWATVPVAAPPPVTRLAGLFGLGASVADARAAMAGFNGQFTGPCAYLYWWEGSLDYSTRWYVDCEQTIAMIRRAAPHGGGVVVLCPVITIDNKAAHPDMAAMDGAPVPMEQWRGTVDRLARAGITIVVWPGYAQPEPIRPLLTYVAQYGLTPKGDAAKWIAKASSN